MLEKTDGPVMDTLGEKGGERAVFVRFESGGFPPKIAKEILDQIVGVIGIRN